MAKDHVTEVVEWCIAILAECPEADKTQTARQVLRAQLMDYQRRVADEPAPPPPMRHVVPAALFGLCVFGALCATFTHCN